MIRFGLEVKEDNSGWGQTLVDDAIATTFTFANITVFDADFVDHVISKARDAIARNVPILQLLDQRLQVGFDVAITFFEMTGFPFECVGNENLVGGDSGITVVIPQSRYRTDASGFDICKGTVNPG